VDVKRVREMAKFSQVDIESACQVAATSLGYSALKEHQLRVVASFVRGNDVFGVLPTGYGKSLCYALLPLVFDRLLSTNNSVVIVIYATYSYNKGPGKF